MRQAEQAKSSDDGNGLLAVYKPIVQAFAIVLSVYYLLISGAHLALLQGHVAQVMAWLAFSTALIFLGLRFTVLKSAQNLTTLGRTMFVLSTLVVVNITAHCALTGDYSQFVYLLMITFGVAMIGPTRRTVGAIYAVIFIAAAYLTFTGPPQAIVNNVFTTITALAMGYVSGTYLHKLIRAQRAAATLANELLIKVEREGRQNEILAAEASSANQAKTDFLANMSHELRTPLNGVVGLANALSSTQLNARQTEMVDLIEKSGETLTRLLTDILDFSKIEAGKIEIERAPFNLRAEIDAAAFLMQARAAEKSLSFEVIYNDAADGWLEGDVTRIKQIVTNLVSNAIKFTQTGSVTATIHYAPDSEILELRVTDTGVGFDAEAGKRLFQRFVQADTSITRRFGGTGLGLAICRGLVDAMGGGMDWSSVPGSGSTFVVRLPAAPAEAPLAKDVAAMAARDENNADTIRILAAEDHETNQKVLSMILEPLGVELLICENGALALEAFKAQAFDLVLMDMQMPVMDGLAATTAIRQYEAQTGAAHTPIIMLTANAMRQHREAAKAAGTDYHVAKPFTPAILIAAIETALAGVGVGVGESDDESEVAA